MKNKIYLSLFAISLALFALSLASAYNYVNMNNADSNYFVAGNTDSYGMNYPNTYGSDYRMPDYNSYGGYGAMGTIPYQEYGQNQCPNTCGYNAGMQGYGIPYGYAMPNENYGNNKYPETPPKLNRFPYRRIH